MLIFTNKNFDKSFAKLSPKIKESFINRLDIFVADNFDPVLNNHSLKGEYFGYRSINVTGDYRAVYKIVATHEVCFIDIGTHSQLYK